MGTTEQGRRKIQVLSDLVINQIAAGEVVDRPASVVRELVDNAVDAGASDVVVYLEGGGRSFIRVVDNGCGMSRSDALLALERHATSKLQVPEDLVGIETLGFRGEALPSIASVSKVRLKTRETTESVGYEIVVEGGAIKNAAPCATNFGTDIGIKQLFFNTPARRKFLRAPETEEKKIKQWLLQFSIAHPGVRFRLNSDGKETLNLPAKTDFLERAKTFFKGDSVSFKAISGQVKVFGLVGHPSLAQFDLDGLLFIVNGRVVQDRMLVRAVRDGYHSMLKGSEYPVGVVKIELPAEYVDVNVHPQKTEVRFVNSQVIFAAVRTAVSDAVLKFTTPRPEAPQSTFEMLPIIERRYGAESRLDGNYSANAYSGTANNYLADSSYVREPEVEWNLNEKITRPEIPAQIENPSFRYSEIRILGQVLGTFIVGEYQGALIVIDMHAAHERVRYNLIREGFSKGEIISQGLLTPIPVTLSMQGVINCINNIHILERWGFQLEQFGEDAILVSSVPAILAEGDLVRIVKEVSSFELAEFASGAIKEKFDHIAARLACHSSVRSGDLLSIPEMKALMQSLDEAEIANACPHGRPVVASFSKDTVSDWFQRD